MSQRVKDTGTWYWIKNRQYGVHTSQAQKARIQKALPSSIRAIRQWDTTSSGCEQNHGGIFGLNFSPDGHILAAACENRSFLLFDPLQGKLIQSKNNAHTDCVNIVKFLDNRTMVSCSDDTTIKMWDVRKFKDCLQQLKGHEDWVKSIEHVSSEGILVTSDFSGDVFAWHINEYTSETPRPKSVFSVSGLMRSKLSPDGKQLFLSTRHGYIMVINNLDIANVSTDLHGFDPLGYRFFQLDGCSSVYPFTPADSNHAFEGDRNRVEFISDFPPGTGIDLDLEATITSLDVHPQGWNLVTRSTSGDDDSEFTCIYDIQTATNYKESAPNVKHKDSEHSVGTEQPNEQSAMPSLANGSREPNTTSNSRISARSTAPVMSSETFLDLWRFPSGNSVTNLADVGRIIYANLGLQGNANNISSIRLARPRRSLPNPSNRYRRTSPHNQKVYQNLPRLTHYVQEPNVARGYIKDPCFSHDGRLVCSPFAYGVRLLAFSPLCDEVCDALPQKPVPLYEIRTNVSHSGAVLSVRYSPTHNLLISGCLSGKVVFHQPVL